jgi:hypothetical protein
LKPKVIKSRPKWGPQSPERTVNENRVSKNGVKVDLAKKNLSWKNFHRSSGLGRTKWSVRRSRGGKFLRKVWKDVKI